ncbi:MAG: hypothetical protein IKY94_03310 [Lachnospiraceae bacterium]|nr:hypothetical protein [Lachnospiraceae bacterium]
MKNINRYLASITKWAEVDRKLYFKSAFDYPGTYCYDLNQNRLFVIEENNNKEEWISFAYGEAVAVKSKVIFIPRNNSYMCIYDTKSGRMSYMKKKYDENYYYGLEYGNKIFMVPSETDNVDRIMAYNDEKDTIEYPFENLKFKVGIKGYGCISGKNLYLPIKNKKQVLKIEIENNRFQCVDVNIGELEVESITYLKDSFYFAGNKAYIIKWDGMEQCKRISFKLENENEQVALYGRANYFNGELIFVNGAKGSIYKLNVDTEKVIEKQVVDLNDGETVGFQNCCEDFFYFEVVPKDVKKRVPYVIDKNNNINILDSLMLNQEMDLINCYSRINYEYSKYALKHFISKLRRKDE